MISGVPELTEFAVVSVTDAFAPTDPLLKLLRMQVCPATPEIGPNAELTVTVPEQVAVPLASVAEVGLEVAPVPPAVITAAVPSAIVFAPVSVTVAVAPVEPLLKVFRKQVCPAVPAIDPPDTYAVPRRMPVLPAAEVKLPLAMMSGVILGSLQELFALVTDAGAQSRYWLLLLPTAQACASKLASVPCEKHCCADPDTGSVTSVTDVTCGCTYTSTGFEVIESADTVTYAVAYGSPPVEGAGFG
jgi:hypothetical protein